MYVPQQQLCHSLKFKTNKFKIHVLSHCALYLSDQSLMHVHVQSQNSPLHLRMIVLVTSIFHPT